MIRLPFIAGGRRDFTLERLAPEDAERLTVLHAQGFSRAWSESEFSELLQQAPVFGFKALEIGASEAPPAGFVLARLAAGEAEILTIAVARSRRRLGLGWLLMDGVLRELHAERAETLFLEVDETNAAAIALYRSLGFRQVGTRPAYYAQAGKTATGALVMRRDLGHPATIEPAPK